MKICPKCGHSQFIVTQHVTQSVLVDGNGEFIKEISACDQVTHSADNDDLWTCAKCLYYAAGSEFDKKGTAMEKKFEPRKIRLTEEGKSFIQCNKIGFAAGFKKLLEADCLWMVKPADENGRIRISTDKDTSVKGCASTYVFKEHIIELD